jgi:hypothetical protein
MVRLSNVPYTLLSRQQRKDTKDKANAQPKSLHCCRVTPLQCRLARTALGWGVRELAQIAQISTQTISRFENGDELRPSTVQKLREIFEAAGVEFIEERGGKGVGVRLAKHEP